MQTSSEAHRALELLEEYHAALKRTQDRDLRAAIERVITIFKSSLFQALLDIQEFYEDTLVDDRKTTEQKTFETQQIAARWESNPPIVGAAGRQDREGGLPLQYIDNNFGGGGGGLNGTSVSRSFERREVREVQQQQPQYQQQSTRTYSPETNDSWPPVDLSGSRASLVTAYLSPIVTQQPFVQLHFLNGSGEHSEEEDIVLEKGHTGLGFSIAGGSDNPHIDNDPSIYVTKIIPGGAAYADGRLQKDDIILRVNTTDTVNVPHHVAVDALKRAGNVVRLRVKRLGAISPGLGPPPPVPTEPPPVQSYQAVSNAYQPSVTKSPAYQPPDVPRYQPHVEAGRQSPASYSSPPRQQQQPSYQTTYTAPPPPPPQTRATPVSTLPPPPPGADRIELFKGSKGLGFSIAGGIGNEHVPGDTGIYVTKIIEGGAAEHDGRLRVGDKLLSVGAVSLELVHHEDAVATLKATSDRVVLTYVKNPHPELMLNSSADTYGAYEPAHQQPTAQPFSYTAPPSTYTAPQPPQSAPPYNSYSNVPVQQQPPARTPVAQPDPYMDNRQQDQMAPVTRSARQFTLTKGPQGLGFNIVGGEDGEPIYISYILPGGAADVSGAVFKGDQLLQVNNSNLNGATHADAAAALKSSGQQVTLVTQYRPEDYARFETRIDELRNEMINQSQMPTPSPRRELCVRALFDYDPSKDSGLPSRGLAFNYGDILHVTNASDDEWWQARRVLSHGAEEGSGIVPSKKRIEKRERARAKQVNFYSGSLDNRRGSKSQLSFSRKFPFMKSKERLNDESEGERAEDNVLSYEAVEQQSLPYARPLIMLGPLKERINDDLITHFPDRYGSCVPHTSRMPHDGEMDGRDYNFVSREVMEGDIRNQLFIEAGQYNGNLYGTSAESVRQVAYAQKHCILDVSANAIRRLQRSNLYPIAVFVKPLAPTQLMEWNRRLDDDEAQRQFQRAQALEESFAEFFTAIVHGHTPEDIYEKVKMVINEQSGPLVWVPSRQPL